MKIINTVCSIFCWFSFASLFLLFYRIVWVNMFWVHCIFVLNYCEMLRILKMKLMQIQITSEMHWKSLFYASDWFNHFKRFFSHCCHDNNPLPSCITYKIEIKVDICIIYNICLVSATNLSAEFLNRNRPFVWLMKNIAQKKRDGPWKELKYFNR